MRLRHGPRLASSLAQAQVPQTCFQQPGSQGPEEPGEGGGRSHISPFPRNGRDSHPRSWALMWVRLTAGGGGGGGLLSTVRLAQLCGCSACQPGTQQAAWASVGRVPGAMEGSLLGWGRSRPGMRSGLISSSLSGAQERACWPGKHPEGQRPRGSRRSSGQGWGRDQRCSE